MKATSYTIQRLPLSEATIEYAERYCAFYEHATYEVGPEAVYIREETTFDPSDSVFWPGNQIF